MSHQQLALKIIDQLIDKISIKDAFILVTKWPTKGKSKTRLSKCIGPDLAIDFSFCALKDLLLYYSTLPHKKFLLFAPKEAKSKFESLLNELNLINDEYELIAMRDSNLSTSDLGSKLSGCMQDIRSNPYCINGSICFIGSDCLELRRKHIEKANKWTHSTERGKNAYIIPATDGGYVLIDLPSSASHKVFDNVKWSDVKTCDSQIAAIMKSKMGVIRSETKMADVDEMDDWLRLCRNFGYQWNKNDDDEKELDEMKVLDYKACFPKVAALLSTKSD